MNVMLGKIIGKMGGKWWGQVHDFVPEEEEKLRRRGRLVAAVGIEGLESWTEMEMVTTGREILSRLHEVYYSEMEEGVLERLKLAIKKIGEEFTGCSVVCVVLMGKALYVASGPGAGVWVKWGEKEGWLVSPEAEEIKALSGWVKEGEVVVIGNNRFWQSVPMGMLKAAVENLDGGVDAGLEALAAFEHGNDRGGGEVGIVLKLEGVEQPAEVVAGYERKIESVVEEEEEVEVENDGAVFKRSEKPQKKMWEKFARWKILPEKMGGGRSVYLSDEEKKKRKRRTMYVAVGILVVLVLMGAVGRWERQRIAVRESESNQRIETLLFQYEEARALVELNPVRSRQLLAEVEAGVAEIEAGGVSDPRLGQIKSGLGEVLGEATGVKKASLVEVVDLGLIREGMKGNRIKKWEGKLVVLDAEGDRVVVVDKAKKNGEVKAGKSGVGDVSLLGTYPGKISVWGDKGVVEIVGEEAKVAVGVETEWKQVVDLELFAGNIYLLDSGAGQIWRYAVTESGFGKRQAWIGEGEETNLAGVTGMAIDGSVWIITSGGTFVKYTRGVKEDITVVGLDGQWGAGALVYTDEETERLYVLDSENGRVVGLKKSGEYEKQWRAEEFKQVTDLVVDEKEGRMYVVGGNKVWEAEL